VTKLPQVSGRECISALSKLGFYIKRQKGSHIVLRRDNPFAQVVVPEHRELDPGTLRGIIRQAGLSVEEFTELL
jgi:predicted RNA binding protein YcfA (HicA-like mRNA interferase family)